ncbi:unnamed protein product [Echinostoma caproni]|uniref:NHR domain-containing protein n=1 Tax=Echinostoma caproni TaxID=27848 RepID=A0A183B142_9TREM|nr:unnamed protein product [Echinostoma caproni]
MASLFFDGLYKGRYVELTAGGTKARRELGFCDGVVLSGTHIRPGELVAVEILETQPGWSGDLRIGFTLLPDEALSPLPRNREYFGCVVTRGQSWIFPVGNAATLLTSHRRRALWRRQQQQQQRRFTRTADSLVPSVYAEWYPLGRSETLTLCVRSDDDAHPVRRLHLNPASPCTCCLYTTFGRVALRRLLPTDGVFLRPPDVEKGSIVAIYYELEACLPTSNPSSFGWTDYFQWSPNPVFDEEEIGQPPNTTVATHVQHEPPETATTVRGESQQTSPSTSSSQDLDSRRSEPMYFQLVFHMVINGFDLVTVSEKIALRRDQLISLPTQSCRSSSSLNPCPLSEAAVEQRLFTPKMRAVLDVYGQTKAVRLVPLNQEPVPRLSRLSSCAILRQIVRIHAPKLPLDSPMSADPSDHYSPSEHTSRTSFKRAKSSLSGSASVNCGGSATAILDTNDENQPIWSKHSTFGRVMDNHRCRVLFSILNKLPLPPSMRRELQRDACAIVWRELID